MEKRLPAFVLVMVLSLAACGSNKNDADNNNQQAEQSTTEERTDQAVPGDNRDLVKFPENYDEGELFTTVTRGDTFEELYTSREAIEAVQSGQPIPSGTIVILKIFRNDELHRYFVMEKRDGCGAEYPSDTRNGEWEYNAFTADGAVAYDEDIGRCFTCHANQERDEYIHKFDEMKSYEFEDVTAATASSTESQSTHISMEDWAVKEIPDQLHYPQGVHDFEVENNFLDKTGEQDDRAERRVDLYREEVVQKVLLMMYVNQLKNEGYFSDRRS